MAEIVGLALAIPGLIPPILSLISEISDLVGNSRRFASDAGTLRVRLNDEDQRIKACLSFLFGQVPAAAAADGGVFRTLPPQTQNHTLSMIVQLFARLKEYTSLEAKYNLTSLDPSISSCDLDMLLRGISLESENPQVKSLQRSSSWLRKLEWSTSGKKRLEGLIEDLAGWNDRIRRVIEDVIWMNLLTASQLQSVAQSSDAKTLGLGPSASMRQLILGSSPAQDLIIPYHKLRIQAAGAGEDPGNLRMAEVNNSHVLVEYKNYELDNDGSIPDITLRQVRQLTTLLHSQQDSGFRVLQCRGYINDRAGSRFGFIYDVPPGAVLPKPLTLDSALNLSSSRSKKPTVTSRLRLAHNLAESLYLLHTVGWVHKNLTSESIIFFTPEGSHAKSIYEKPWIVGFEYSRLESDFSSNRKEDRIEKNIYRHWERWGKPTVRSAKIHDIYSLGVILLEIGLWASARTLSRDGFQSHSNDREYVRDALRKAAQGKLGFAMGERYERLVLLCLKGREEAFGVENDDRADTQLQREFRERVIDVLKLSSEYI